MNFPNDPLKKSFAAAGALCVCIALVFVPTVAQAVEPGLTLQEETSVAPQSVFDKIDEALMDLNGTQTQDEIDSLIGAGNTHVLVDGDTGEKLAAIHTGPIDTQTAFAISQLGSGCSLVSACLTTSANVNLGFVGTGTKNMNFTNIKRAAAGTITTAVKTSTGATHHIPAKIMVTFLRPQTVKQMTRG